MCARQCSLQIATVIATVFKANVVAPKPAIGSQEPGVRVLCYENVSFLFEKAVVALSSTEHCLRMQGIHRSLLAAEAVPLTRRKFRIWHSNIQDPVIRVLTEKRKKMEFHLKQLALFFILVLSQIAYKLCLDQKSNLFRLLESHNQQLSELWLLLSSLPDSYQNLQRKGKQ